MYAASCMSVGIGDIPIGWNTSTAFSETVAKLASPYPSVEDDEVVVAVSVSLDDSIGLQERDFITPGPDENPVYPQILRQYQQQHDLQQLKVTWPRNRVRYSREQSEMH